MRWFLCSYDVCVFYGCVSIYGCRLIVCVCSLPQDDADGF